MPAQLIDLNQEFDLGNSFTLEVGHKLAHSLSDEYRVIIKYDLGDKLPRYGDNRLNILITTSRETHDVPSEFFREDVFIIFQHYFMLDKWGHPMYNPLVYPLPLGPFRDLSNLLIRPLPERKYDFSFVGQIPDTGTRDCFKRNLDKLIEEKEDKYKFYIKYTDGFSQGLSPEEYLKILGETKISLCPTGANSDETFRFFESIMTGAIPLVAKLPKLWYYETAPHLVGPWINLDSTLSQVLNFLQKPKSRKFLYQVADYCGSVLAAKNLATHLKERVEFRRANRKIHEQPLEQIRKKLNEMDTL